MRWLDLHTWYAPVLWMLGLLHASAALLLVAAAVHKWPRGRAINLLVVLWLAIGVLQAIAALLNGLWLGSVEVGLRNALSFTALGWFFAAFALASGASLDLCGPLAARLFSRLAVHTLLLGTFTLLAAGAGWMLHTVPTPATMVASGSEVVRQYAGVKFFHSETTLGATTTRLVLMYPWAPALGLGSLGLALISTRCAHRGWRCAGMLGGLMGVVFSWSRLAMLAGVLAFAILAFLRSPRWLRMTGVLLLTASFAVAVLLGFSPLNALYAMHDSVDSARAGSSLARDLIVEQSWAGFLRSPWIGHGWVGESVHPTENLPIGSHSTVYGTLYTGGALVFTAFATAMLALLVLLGWRLATERDPQRAKDIHVALCLGVCLFIAARYEAIYSLSLPCFFYFAWIGGALAPASGAEDHVVDVNAVPPDPMSARVRSGWSARPARQGS